MPATCERKDCNPKLQTRGEMGPGDYADVVKAHRYVPPWEASTRVNAVTVDNYHEMVELEDSNRTDIRVCCLTCGKATGWNERDAPSMPGVGVGFIKQVW